MAGLPSSGGTGAGSTRTERGILIGEAVLSSCLKEKQFLPAIDVSVPHASSSLITPVAVKLTPSHGVDSNREGNDMGSLGGAGGMHKLQLSLLNIRRFLTLPCRRNRITEKDDVTLDGPALHVFCS